MDTHRRLARNGPTQRKSQRIIMAALEHLKTHGPTISTDLAAVIGCGPQAVGSGRPLVFNTLLMEQGIPWRFTAESTFVGNGAKVVTWSVREKGPKC